MTTFKMGACGGGQNPLVAPILGTPIVAGSNVTVPVNTCSAGATVTVTQQPGGATQSVACGGGSPSFSALANGTYTYTATQLLGAQGSVVSNQVSAVVNVSAAPLAITCVGISNNTSGNTASATMAITGTVPVGMTVVMQWATLANVGTGPWTVFYNQPAAAGNAVGNMTGLSPGVAYVVRGFLVDSLNVANPAFGECQFTAAAGAAAPTIACGGITGNSGGNFTVSYTVGGTIPAGAYLHVQAALTADVNTGPWTTVSDGPIVVGNNAVSGTATIGADKTVQGYIISSTNAVLAGPAVCQYIQA